MLATCLSGPGLGRFNGYGGKVNPGESIHACALREFEEEAGGARVSKLALEMGRFWNVGVVHVTNRQEDGTIRFAEVYVYVVREWVGDIVSTDVMRNPAFHSIRNIPRLNMLPGDKYWLPHFLARKENGGQASNMHAWVEYLPGFAGLASEPIVICNDENDSREDDLPSGPFAEF